MNRDGFDFHSAGTGFAFAFGFVLILLAAGRPLAETVREMESDRGKVRIAIVPLDAPPPPAADSSRAIAPPVPPTGEVPDDSLHPVLAIADFTSLDGIPREAEAMLQVDFYDKASRRELRFPLKYSELRRYLRAHPREYRQGTLEERNIALIEDLAASLRIRMQTPSAGGDKP